MGNNGILLDGVAEINALSRVRLTELEERTVKLERQPVMFRGFRWFRIKGYTKFWKNDESIDLYDIQKSILGSIVNMNSVFGSLVAGNGKNIRFYIGISDNTDIVKTYEAFYPGIEIEPAEDLSGAMNRRFMGGMVSGYPKGYYKEGEKPGEERKQTNMPIDNICRGMYGSEFVILTLARRQRGIDAAGFINMVSTEIMNVSERVNATNIAGSTTARQRVNYGVKLYMDQLERLSVIADNGTGSGLWESVTYYGAYDRGTAEKLRGIIKSTYSVKDAAFEPIKCIPLDDADISRCISMPAMTDEGGPNDYILMPWLHSYYHNLYDADSLARLCMLPVLETPGIYLDDYVEFDSAMRTGGGDDGLYIGNICRPGRGKLNKVENSYSIPINDFTRHALIIGITGGGKTNTAKSLLSELYLEHGKPFLVIESAKREYIELMNLRDRESSGGHKNFSGLLLFTLGGEGKNSIPYRINPFEIAGEGSRKVSLQTHIDSLLSTFKASFELYSPMPYVLETAVYQVYTDRGWDIINNNNRYGWTEYPTLTDLYYKIDEVVDSLGYHAEVRSNVKAALKARINSLRIGGKGAMLDVSRSVPIEQILSYPAVMELEDLGDDETKSFVIGILMVQLYEYRKSKMETGAKQLQHVLMIEEAHRLLKNPAGQEGSKANSVEFFCNMLAEIRTFGQGILIADQIPTKLAPDTIKNTNLKILHRTVMREDREAMGFGMNMTDEQIGYVSSLRRGCAAVYAEGDSRPKLVMLPLMEDYTKLEREEAIERIRSNINYVMPNYDVKYDYHIGCMFCGKKCVYRGKTEKIAEDNMLDSKSPLYNKLISMPKNAKTINSWVGYINERLPVKLSGNEKLCLAGELIKRLGYSAEQQYVAIRDMAVYHLKPGR